MLNFVPKEFVLVAGLLAAPVACMAQSPAAAPVKDPRQIRLEKYFSEHHCALRELAAEFVAVADENNLDWRLLPSLSMVETGGGRGTRNNNLFGWNCGRTRFDSPKASIHVVASKLSQSKAYKGKDTDGILKTYNSNPRYGARVKAVMETIGSGDLGTTALAAVN